MNYLKAWRTRHRLSFAEAGERVGISAAQFEAAEQCGKVYDETQRELRRHFFREIAELQRPPTLKATAESTQRDHDHRYPAAYSRVKWHRHGGTP